MLKSEHPSLDEEIHPEIDIRNAENYGITMEVTKVTRFRTSVYDNDGINDDYYAVEYNLTNIDNSKFSAIDFNFTAYAENELCYDEIITFNGNLDPGTYKSDSFDFSAPGEKELTKLVINFDSNEK